MSESSQRQTDLHSTQDGTLNVSMVRLGVVGVRNIGKNHIRRSLEVAGAKVVAVADADADRVKQTQEEFDIETGYTDAAALFKQDDIDAVVLALPNHLHVPLSIAAMEAGKDVLVEKPLASTSKEARLAIEARDRTGRLLVVGMNQRFRPHVAAARALIASGQLGKVRFCKTHWTRPGYTQAATQQQQSMASRGPWQFDRSRGGGPLLDLGIHKLDLAMYILGFPAALEVMSTSTSKAASLNAKSMNLPCDVEDYAMGMFRLKGNILLELTSALSDPSASEETHSVFIGCENGGVLQNKGGVSAFTYDEYGQATPLPLPDQGHLTSSPVEHLVRVIQGKDTLVTTPEEAVQGLEMLEAMLLSDQQQRTIFMQ